MIYSNKRIILFVLTMCGIALSSVKAQEARASVGRTRKTQKASDGPQPRKTSCKSSKACHAGLEELTFISGFKLTAKQKKLQELEDSVIVDSIIGVFEDNIGDSEGLDVLVRFNDCTRKDDLLTCRVFTDNSICVLDREQVKKDLREKFKDELEKAFDRKTYIQPDQRFVFESKQFNVLV